VGTDGRVDPGQVGAGEAEALVVARIALDENERLAALVGQPQRFVHQRAADAAAVMRRQNRERAELKDLHGTGLDVDVAQHHVPDDLAIDLGNEGELGDEAGGGSDRIDQPGYFLLTERLLVDREDRRPIRLRLRADLHAACNSAGSASSERNVSDSSGCRFGPPAFTSSSSKIA